MRRVVAALVVPLLLLLPPPAGAARTGDITGVIRNETHGRPQPGAKVTLVHLRMNEEEPELTTVTTDNKGRYAFDDLPTGEEHLYALDVKHQGGLFASGTIQMPDDTDEPPVVEADVTVWDTTDDPRAIVLRRNDMFVTPGENQVDVLDSYRIINPTDLAYIGRGGADASTSLGFALPKDGGSSGVRIVNEPRIDIPNLQPTDFGFGITAAIPPGQTNLVFSYSVEGTAGSYDLTRNALYPILDSSVFVQEPLEVRSNRLEKASDEPVDVGGEEYIEYAAADDIDAGDAVQILAVAEAGMSPWLVVGVSILFGVIALILAVGIVIRRRSSAKSATSKPVTEPAPMGREQVVLEIAELDLRYRSGDLAEEEWRARREELKSRVDERSPEPTR